MTLQEASLNITEAQYRELPALSYSSLATFDREGYSCLDTLFDSISTPSLVFGSMVDCLMTEGDDTFAERYTVMDINLPAEAIVNIVDQLCESHAEKQFALVSDEDILLAANAYEWCRSWKPATRISKIRETGSNYYNLKKKNEGKLIVVQQDVDDAKKCAETLKADPITSWYFAKDTFDNIERLYQLKFQITDAITKIPVKGMLDLVIIDHDKKVIYPCDLKTTKNIYTFEESFYKWRYYMQAAVYKELLKQTIAEKCPELQDYVMASYRFIAISRNSFKPVVFQWPTYTYIETMADPYGRPLSNWRATLRDLQWALDNKDKQLPRLWQASISEDGFVRIPTYSINVSD